MRHQVVLLYSHNHGTALRQITQIQVNTNENHS